MSIRTLDYVTFLHQANLSKTTKHWDGFVSHCILGIHIQSASLDLSAIFKYILMKLNYLRSPQSSTGTASYDLRLQSQHVPSISLVPSDGLKFNCTGSVLFDSVFSRYHSLFLSSVYFNTDFGSIAASRILCSLIGLLRTSQNFTIQHSTSPLSLQLVGLG